MNFESELSKGNFKIPECTNCKKIVWPPTKFCNSCFNEITLRDNLQPGKILEFSKKDEQYFCLAEFEDHVRILGAVSEKPNAGDTVSIKQCGIKDGSYYFEFMLNSGKTE